MVQCLQPSSSWHSYLIHFLPSAATAQYKCHITNFRRNPENGSSVVLRSLPLFLTATAGSATAVEKKDFP